MREEIDSSGFAVIRDVLPAGEVLVLLASIEAAGREVGWAGKGGVRHLLDRVPRVRELAESARIRSLVEPVLCEQALVVRGILFDKTPHANWKVPWHQDLTIAVQERIEAAGFGPWTVKDGVPHVQPPTEILEGMLAVRIHLDACGEENGPVRVIPGSHSRGRLNAAQIQSIQEGEASVSCCVGQGGVLLMRPLLLHASSAATSPGHRRVIHIEFAGCGLPGGLRWY